MKSLKIHYSAEKYASHWRVATVYQEMLRSMCEVVEDGNQASVIVLHYEPHDFGSIYRRFPALKTKYVIAYCVWEADELPEAYKESISLVQEVWTASRYCCDIFGKYHNRVVYLPHVIERDNSCSPEDREYVKEAIGYEKDCIYYLTIIKMLDPRKNVEALIKAFRNIRERMPQARLIIKATAEDPPNLIREQQVIYLPQELTWSQLNALYELSQVYVSAHHSEGWGLTLSDAMIFKKPVIATGYSGNLEFMNAENSFLVDFKEEYIHPQDCFSKFNSRMKWAYPDPHDLEAKLWLLYNSLKEDWVAEKIGKAAADIRQFDRNTVGALLERALNRLPIIR
jgi:glycosyltransferase involved in cell wall biosynthesis